MRNLTWMRRVLQCHASTVVAIVLSCLQLLLLRMKNASPGHFFQSWKFEYTLNLSGLGWISSIYLFLLAEFIVDCRPSRYHRASVSFLNTFSPFSVMCDRIKQYHRRLACFAIPGCGALLFGFHHSQFPCDGWKTPSSGSLGASTTASTTFSGSTARVSSKKIAWVV